MTMITNPGDPKVQAIFLRGHLRLLSLGLKNSRLSGTQILRLAGNITGKSYKRGQYRIARDDLEAFIDRDGIQ
jgi:hypothetical protein